MAGKTPIPSPTPRNPKRSKSGRVVAPPPAKRQPTGGGRSYR